MKPSKFSSGERILEAFHLQAHHPHVPFSRFYNQPDREYSFMDRLSYDHSTLIFEDGPFRNPILMRTMGSFISALNKFFDKDNQITLFIEDKDGHDLELHADNIFTLNNVRGRIYEMFEDFAETKMKKIGVPKYIDSFVTTEKARILHSKKSSTACFNQEALPSPAVSANILMERYIHGIHKDYLTKPLTSYASFKLDIGYHEIKISDIESNSSNSNRPTEYPGEKPPIENQNCFDKHWDIRFFEGPKAEAYQKLKSFLQNNLAVTVDISEFSPSTIEVRGDQHAVELARIVGAKTVPLINEGKVMDQIWLENALTDAKIKTSIKKICEEQGTYFSEQEAEKARRKARLKGFSDISPVAA